MLTWYRELIRLRRTKPCLNDPRPGNTVVTFDEHQNWIRMQRGTITAICNLGISEHSFAVPPESTILLASRAAPQNVAAKVMLPPNTIAVLAGPGPFVSSHQPYSSSPIRVPRLVACKVAFS
jgi:maltooligosyltrehalose trehalohydrolase